MFKRIRQGEVLTISGENIYSGVDTSVYFNSAAEANKAEIIAGSFNAEDTRVEINVPCCLPELNQVIVYNGVTYTTGSSTYQFVGPPTISGFSPTSQEWYQKVTVYGNDLIDITGVFVDNIKVTKRDWPVDSSFSFEVPADVISGKINVYTEVGFGSSEESFIGIPPPIGGNLSNDSLTPKYLGQRIGVENGKSLHKVNRVAFSGLDSKVYQSTLSHFGSTGIRFNLPEGVAENSPVVLQHQSGKWVGGTFVENIHEEFTLGNPLNVYSNYIHSLSEVTEAYNNPITISGINVDKSKIFFKGYNGESVEAPSVATGFRYNTVTIPKNIVKGGPVASGYVDNRTGVHTSANHFYPLPTIQSVSSSTWNVGDTISIEGINASQIELAVVVSGYDKINGRHGVHLVSNPASLESFDNRYFGAVSVDNTALVSDTINGHSLVTAVINSTMAGEGVPFLVNEEEADFGDGEKGFFALLSGSNTLNRIHSVKGDPITIKGKQPEVIGLDPVFTSFVGVATISGKHFTTLTGVKLYNPMETKSIPKSGLHFMDVNLNLIKLTKTGIGNESPYEYVHSIEVDLSDFNFQSKQGQVVILTPYHG